MAIDLLTHLNDETIARFWQKVQKRGPDECWEWTGCRNPKGYGAFAIKKKPRRPNRIVLTLALGRNLLPNELACHTCDNPPCCNPAHLFVGSAAENTHDMISKGRASRGEKNPGSKITEADVRRIRELGATVSQAKLAEIYGLGGATISRIINRRRWAYVL